MRGGEQLENSCSIFDVFSFTTPFAPTALSFVLFDGGQQQCCCVLCFHRQAIMFWIFLPHFLTLFRSQLTHNRSGKYYCGDILVNSVTRLIQLLNYFLFKIIVKLFCPSTSKHEKSARKFNLRLVQECPKLCFSVSATHF